MDIQLLRLTLKQLLQLPCSFNGSTNSIKKFYLLFFYSFAFINVSNRSPKTLSTSLSLSRIFLRFLILFGMIIFHQCEASDWWRQSWNKRSYFFLNRGEIYWIHNIFTSKESDSDFGAHMQSLFNFFWGGVHDACWAENLILLL